MERRYVGLISADGKTEWSGHFIEFLLNNSALFCGVQEGDIVKIADKKWRVTYRTDYCPIKRGFLGNKNEK